MLNKDIHQKYPWLATEDHKGNFEQLDEGIKIISDRVWEVPAKKIESMKTIGIAVSNETRETDIVLFKN